MMDVLIADDHEFIRAGLRSILAETSDIKVAKEAGDGQTVLQALRERAFDLLILDMSMPGLSGLELIKRIKTCVFHATVTADFSVVTGHFKNIVTGDFRMIVTGFG